MPDKTELFAFNRSPAWLFSVSLRYSSSNSFIVQSPNTEYCLQRRSGASIAFLDDNFFCDSEGM